VHIQNQTVPANAKKFAPDVHVWEQDGHIVRVETNGKKGDAGYYKYEQTKLHPTDQRGNNTMRWLMMEKGLPVRTAWQEYDKHWDQIHTGMIGMVGGAGRYMPRHVGAGGGGPRSAWQEPIAARSRNGGAGNSGNGGSHAGKAGPKPSNTVVESPPPAPKPYTGPNPAMGEKGTLPGNPPPMRPPAPGPKAPAAPAAPVQPPGKNIVAGKGDTLPGKIYRKMGKPAAGPPPEIPSIPKQSGAKLNKQQVYDVFNADRGRIGWSMTQAEHVRQWQNANPGAKEPPPVAFTTRDGRVQVSEKMWIESGEGPLWGYVPGGPADSHH
jgi:hypothetical protein